MYTDIQRIEILSMIQVSYKLVIHPLVHAVWSLDTHQSLLVLMLIELWLMLHYSCQVNKIQVRCKQQIVKANQQAHEATQIAILEQAMLFDRELRKVQEDLQKLKKAIHLVKDLASTTPNDIQAEKVQDIMEAFISAKLKGLRRMCIAGRGWVSVRRVQHELGLSDNEVRSLCNV